ncbi:MAG: DUF885 domain-containing protein [Alphaproteobacteria bacterium]|nr:DUF885 domain-containing protein [Alphaproteobacteria bacterium]MDE2492844.1 DUF885 domain-containing protein [Alphaproteobacteria bacterium]
MSVRVNNIVPWFLRSVAFVLALAAAGAGYVVYATVWGTPFRFNDLLNRQAIFEALDSPQTLTRIGITDGTWYDFTSGKLDPYSLAARQKRFDRARRFDARIAAWNKASLAPQERLSYDIVRWSYARRLADEKYPWLGANNDLYPVNQAFGIQQSLPNFLLSVHRITNARLARHYVQRLKALGGVLDALRLDVSRQAAAGVIAPDFIIDDSIAQMKAMIAPVPGESPLVKHLAERTEAIGMDGAERDALINQAVVVMQDTVYPAYRRLIAEETALRAHATHDAGVWRLKDGAAYYADQLKTLISTDMSPDDIHAYGLSEVARITAEMDIVLKSVGLTGGSVGERMDRLMADPRFLYPNNQAGRAQMLARYRQILGRAKMLLPEYFSHIPGIPLEVRRVPPFAEKGAPGAYYQRPSLDGRRPGMFFANLRNVAETPMWAMPTLAYHEGIPGHHLQIATAIEVDGLPLQRRMGFLPAYGEGWALYAEHLAKDMGLYHNDPYGDLGRLQAELFRAARLVVDTGIHAKRWSREQAIAYMQATTGMAASDVTAEVERYVVWPGQACAYKIGMKTILDLRTRAESELGPRFDIKEFHGVILENGAMPLWLLQKNVDRWMAEKEGLGQPH